MKKDKQTYAANKEVIMRNITSGCKDKNDVIPLEMIYVRRKKLCSLKHNGKTLQEALGKCIQNVVVVFVNSGTTDLSRHSRSL